MPREGGTGQCLETFVCHDWRGRSTCYPVGEGQAAVRPLTRHSTAPQQSLTQPQVSAVLRLRNPPGVIGLRSPGALTLAPVLHEAPTSLRLGSSRWALVQSGDVTNVFQSCSPWRALDWLSLRVFLFPSCYFLSLIYSVIACFSINYCHKHVSTFLQS